MQLLTIKEVCGILKCGRTMLYRLTRAGKLPVVRLGASVRYRAEDVQKLIAGLLSGSN